MDLDWVHLLDFLDVQPANGTVCSAAVARVPLDTACQHEALRALQCLLERVCVCPHLDSLPRGASEEQVTSKVEAETPDRALVAQEVSFALEDLLRLIGS